MCYHQWCARWRPRYGGSRCHARHWRWSRGRSDQPLQLSRPEGPQSACGGSWRNRGCFHLPQPAMGAGSVMPPSFLPLAHVFHAKSPCSLPGCPPLQTQLWLPSLSGTFIQKWALEELLFLPQIKAQIKVSFLLSLASLSSLPPPHSLAIDFLLFPPAELSNSFLVCSLWKHQSCCLHAACQPGGLHPC